MRWLLCFLALAGCALEQAPDSTDREEARPYARLSINMIGVHGCSVHVDGIDIGVAPIFQYEATAGTHLLSLRCPDGRHLEQNVTMALGTEHKYSFRPEELRADR